MGNNLIQKNKCRVCKGCLYAKPLLSFKNMPKAAQYLPLHRELKKERGISFSVYQCSSCGLIQLSVKPVPYYKEVIRAVAFSKEMKEFRLKQLAIFSRKYSLGKGKVIEIGCGRGEYLELIKKVIPAAYGIEYSSKSVAICLNKGLSVFRGFPGETSVKWKYGPFDAFFMFSFLEHLPDPLEVLRNIALNLKEGGKGLIEVPNFDMMICNKLFSEFIPDHLFYFTKKTFINVLEFAGFEVLECSSIWHNYILSAIVKKRTATNVLEFVKAQEKITTEIISYISKFKKVAVWGAGHQSLAVLALSRLKGKVAYVVDSADFKQGKYTPVTHIPIFSPKRLISDPVEAVIVMAGSYSNEVLSWIKHYFSGKFDVVILTNNGLKKLKK